LLYWCSKPWQVLPRPITLTRIPLLRPIIFTWNHLLLLNRWIISVVPQEGIFFCYKTILNGMNVNIEHYLCRSDVICLHYLIFKWRDRRVKESKWEMRRIGATRGYQRLFEQKSFFKKLKTSTKHCWNNTPMHYARGSH
jgi:hypothetical protein